MRICYVCKQSKDDNELSGRRNICQSCHKEEVKKYRHPERDKINDFNRKIKYRFLWHNWFREQGLSIPESNKVIYHHRRPEEKSFTIGRFIKNHKLTPKNIALLQDEIDKCSVLTFPRHTLVHKLAKRLEGMGVQVKSIEGNRTFQVSM